MPQNHSDFDALGDAIEAIIDQAISSQNFQKMNQTIRQVVSSAVDTGSDEKVRRALKKVVPTYRSPEEVNAKAEQAEEMKMQREPALV